jgi:hypothetical protein
VDNAMQDALYAETVAAVFGQLMGGAVDPESLVPGILASIAERRILAWSARPEEAAQLAEFALAGGLPVSDETTVRPGLYVVDNVGSKLNYYLTQSIVIEHGVCSTDGRADFRGTINLASSVPDPSTLSESILGAYEWEDLEPGIQRLIVMLYAPPGATITGARVDGVPVVLEPLADDGYPVGKVVVSIPPGGTASISYDFVVASGAPEPEPRFTPLVNPTAVEIMPLDCSTVAIR